MTCSYFPGVLFSVEASVKALLVARCGLHHVGADLHLHLPVWRLPWILEKLHWLHRGTVRSFMKSYDCLMFSSTALIRAKISKNMIIKVQLCPFLSVSSGWQPLVWRRLLCPNSSPVFWSLDSSCWPVFCSYTTSTNPSWGSLTWSMLHRYISNTPCTLLSLYSCICHNKAPQKCLLNDLLKKTYKKDKMAYNKEIHENDIYHWDTGLSSQQWRENCRDVKEISQSVSQSVESIFWNALDYPWNIRLFFLECCHHISTYITDSYLDSNLLVLCIPEGFYIFLSPGRRTWRGPSRLTLVMWGGTLKRKTWWLTRMKNLKTKVRLFIIANFFLTPFWSIHGNR